MLFKSKILNTAHAIIRQTYFCHQKIFQAVTDVLRSTNCTERSLIKVKKKVRGIQIKRKLLNFLEFDVKATQTFPSGNNSTNIFNIILML